MSLISEIKIEHIKSFQEGNIKQATFLKTFKREIFDLIEMEYKPAEIKGFLERKMDVSINMNSFYSWLNYTKEKESSKKGERLYTKRSIEEEKGSTDYQTFSARHNYDEQDRSEKPKSTMDILSSTDFD